MIELEIRNDGDRSFYAKACKSELSGVLYIHIGMEKHQIHGKSVKVLPYDYERLEVESVKA